MPNELQELDNTPIDTQIKTFAQLKVKRTQLDELKKELDERYYALRTELLKTMTEKRVLTLKTEDYTIVRASRRMVVIADANKAIKYFKGIEMDLPTKIDYYAAMPIFNAALKDGKKIPGIEEKPAEYVSVKLNKKTEA